MNLKLSALVLALMGLCQAALASNWTPNPIVSYTAPAGAFNFPVEVPPAMQARTTSILRVRGGQGCDGVFIELVGRQPTPPVFDPFTGTYINGPDREVALAIQLGNAGVSPFNEQ